MGRTTSEKAPLLNQPEFFRSKIKPGMVFSWKNSSGHSQWFLILGKPFATCGGIWYDVKAANLLTGEVFEGWPAEGFTQDRQITGKITNDK